MSQKPLNPWIWSLYDFANSFASIIVSFYFSLFVVTSLGRSDLWVSAPVALTTVLLVLTLPFFGSIADRMKRYKPTLALTTIIAIAALFSLGVFAALSLHHPWMFIFVLLFYFLFQYFYQAAFAFYMPFMQELSKKHERSFVASIGLAAGQLGNVVALLIAVPFVESGIHFAGTTGIPLVFCFGAVMFFILYIPFHLKFREPNEHSAEFYQYIPKSIKELFTHLLELRKYPNVLRYLIAYYFFADAILTLQLFASLYLEKIGFLATKGMTYAFVVGLIMAVVGALITPWFARKVGNLKKALSGVLLSWSVLLLLLVVAKTHWQMVIIVGLNGLAFGMLFALSRIMYSKIIPADQPAKYFGLYVLFERFASVLGPLVWSGGVAVFIFTGEITKYRIATALLAIMVLIAYAIFRTVKEEYH